MARRKRFVLEGSLPVAPACPLPSLLTGPLKTYAKMASRERGPTLEAYDSGSGLVTVSCAQHHHTLVEGLWNLWQAKRGLDVYFQWGGQSFETHQMLVDIFLSQEKLGRADIDPATIEQGELLNSLLEFMYNGTVRIRRDKVDVLLDVAKQVDFTLLVNALERSKNGGIPKCTCTHPDHGDQATSEETSMPLAKPVKSILKVKRRLSGEQPAESSDEDAANRSKHLPADTGSAEGPVPEPTKCADEGIGRRVSLRQIKRVSIRPSTSSRRVVRRRPRDDDMSDSSLDVEDDAEDSDYDSGAAPRRATQTDKKKVAKSATSTRRFGRKTWRAGNERNPAKSNVVLTESDPCSADQTETSDGDDSTLPEDVTKRLKVLAEELPLPDDVYTSLPMLECPDCDYKTNEFHSHVNHIRTAHKVSTRIRPSIPDVIFQDAVDIPDFRCRLCDFVCATHGELKAHHRATHPGLKPFKCPHCDLTFNRRCNLSIHAESCDRNTRNRDPFCELCSRSFLTNYRLKVHMSRVHLGERLYMCHVCGKGLSTQASLLIHGRIHSGEKPFVCDTCGKSFSDRTTLKRHLVLHVPNQPRLLCHLCSRSFKRTDALNLHIKQYHTEGGQPYLRRSKNASSGKPPRQNWRTMIRRTFTCRLCTDPPVTGYRTEMERHQKTDHPGEKIFKCVQCEFYTSNVSMLTVHGRVHTGEKPYKCEECGRCFRDPSNYRGHLKYHARGEKRFRCFTCSHTFHLRGNLKFHLRKVHKLSAEDVDAALAGNMQVQELEQEEMEAQVQDVVGTICEEEEEQRICEDDGEGMEEEETHNVIVHVDGVLDLADPNLVYFVT